MLWTELLLCQKEQDCLHNQQWAHDSWLPLPFPAPCPQRKGHFYMGHLSLKQEIRLTCSENYSHNQTPERSNLQSNPISQALGKQLFWWVTLLLKQVRDICGPDKNLFTEEEQRVPAILGTMTMAPRRRPARLHGISVCKESLREEGRRWQILPENILPAQELTWAILLSWV